MTYTKKRNGKFWPTFLIVLPLSGVLASLFTIYLAVQNAPMIENENIGRFAKEAPVKILDKTRQY